MNKAPKQIDARQLVGFSGAENVIDLKAPALCNRSGSKIDEIQGPCDKAGELDTDQLVGFVSSPDKAEIDEEATKAQSGAKIGEITDIQQS